MIRIPNATPTTASVNTNNHHEPRRSIHQSYNPRLRPKSAPKYNINRLIGSQQEATVRYSPATTKTTVLSPRVNKQRLFDPFNVVQEPVQPQPQRRNRTPAPSPRKYKFVSPPVFNEFMQQKTSTTWRNYNTGPVPNANNNNNNNNRMLLPKSYGLANTYLTKTGRVHFSPVPSPLYNTDLDGGKTGIGGTTEPEDPGQVILG